MDGATCTSRSTAAIYGPWRTGCSDRPPRPTTRSRAWLRLNRCDADEIDNIGGWAHDRGGTACLNMLRSRRPRREDPLDAVHSPSRSPRARRHQGPGTRRMLGRLRQHRPLRVLDQLPPDERLGVSYSTTSSPSPSTRSQPLDRSARRRPASSRAAPGVGSARRRAEAGPRAPAEVVDAFFARRPRTATWTGSICVLDPDVVLRSQQEGVSHPDGSVVVRGAEAVAGRAMMFARSARDTCVPRSSTAPPVSCRGARGSRVPGDGLHGRRWCVDRHRTRRGPGAARGAGLDGPDDEVRPALTNRRSPATATRSGSCRASRAALRASRGRRRRLVGAPGPPRSAS